MNTNVSDIDNIIIDRLLWFFSKNYFCWGNGKTITLDDISKAINENQQEENEIFSKIVLHELEDRSTEWHIGRVIYFINHPEEISEIQIDNECDNWNVYPVPVIEDGNHRLLAAVWLQSQGKMDKIPCIYNGRLDLLDYLTGNSDIIPE